VVSRNGDRGVVRVWWSSTAGSATATVTATATVSSNIASEKHEITATLEIVEISVSRKIYKTDPTPRPAHLAHNPIGLRLHAHDGLPVG
jgi:hypothetical protein